LLRDQRWGDPLTASVASGIKVARVRSWLEHGTWEPVASMPREEPKWKPHEGQSTDAGHRGGWARSSVEVPVMGMERRGPITQFRRRVNQAIGRNPAGRRGRRPGDKSRMRRESHVRFREGLGVKFPRATRLVILVDAFPQHDWLLTAVVKRLREELAKLGVEVNEEKSRVVDLAKGESFGFLGFEFRRIRSLGGVWRAQYAPKLKKRTALLGKLKEIFRRFRSEPVGRVVQLINPILRGWVNYFAVGHSSRCFSFVRDWVEKKMRRHLMRARQRRGFGWRRWSRPWLYEGLGLFNGYRVRRYEPRPKASPT
jgi:hypothetical protein